MGWKVEHTVAHVVIAFYLFHRQCHALVAAWTRALHAAFASETTTPAWHPAAHGTVEANAAPSPQLADGRAKRKRL